MNKLRVLYVLKNFPQMSETYIKTEIEAVQDQCQIMIVATKKANLPSKNHAPYRYVPDPSKIRSVIEEFRPHVLHGHWLHTVRLLGRLAKWAQIPFTVRAHSFDSIWPDRDSSSSFWNILGDYSLPRHIRRAVPWINDKLCLGILAFPFARPRLEKAGIRGEKIVDCYPVINFRRFYDRSPNGDAIMNVGACIPKKRMEDFVELGVRAAPMQFDLYALGYSVDKFHELNKTKGSPINIIPPVELENMPAEYKKHRWLVYTARPGGNVGWPMAIAEAQASGVGVCMANIRADLRDYVGNAGFLYNSLSEALEIISKPFPDELREKGFQQAKKADIFEHRALLVKLWQKANPSDLLREPETQPETGSQHVGT